VEGEIEDREAIGRYIFLCGENMVEEM
jgi:hypothetical protein